MKILFVVPTYPPVPGEPGEDICELAKILALRGYDVTAAAGHGDGLDDGLVQDLVDVRRFRLEGSSVAGPCGAASERDRFLDLLLGGFWSVVVAVDADSWTGEYVLNHARKIDTCGVVLIPCGFRGLAVRNSVFVDRYRRVLNLLMNHVEVIVLPGVDGGDFAVLNAHGRHVKKVVIIPHVGSWDSIAASYETLFLRVVCGLVVDKRPADAV